MAIFFGPFDGAGPGSSITEAFWILMAKHFLHTGVVKGELNEFASFADSTGMQVKVPTGRGFVEGQMAYTDALTTLAISAAHATLPRIDRVVLRKDNLAKTMALIVLTGTAASSPAAPALTQTANTWDMPISQVLVAAAATTIAAGAVTDERTLVQNVDVNAVQAIANKAFTNVTIADLTGATHGHTTTASGGALGVDSVGAAQIAGGAVGASEIADGAVGTPELADGSVTDGKLAVGAVTSTKLGAFAVTPAKESAAAAFGFFGGGAWAYTNNADGTPSYQIMTGGPYDGYTITYEYAGSFLSAQRLRPTGGVAGAIANSIVYGYSAGGLLISETHS